MHFHVFWDAKFQLFQGAGPLVPLVVVVVQHFYSTPVKSLILHVLYKPIFVAQNFNLDPSTILYALWTLVTQTSHRYLSFKRIIKKHPGHYINVKLYYM